MSFNFRIDCSCHPNEKAHTISNLIGGICDGEFIRSSLHKPIFIAFPFVWIQWRKMKSPVAKDSCIFLPWMFNLGSLLWWNITSRNLSRWSTFCIHKSHRLPCFFVFQPIKIICTTILSKKPMASPHQTSSTVIPLSGLQNKPDIFSWIHKMQNLAFCLP